MQKQTLPRWRRGGVYIFVLGSSIFVSLVGLSALAMTQVSARSVTQGNDVAQASALAESAVELALMKFGKDSSWQVDYPVGVATTPVAVGNGTMSFKWNLVAGGARIYGIGKVHNATRIYSVKATLGNPIDALLSALVGGSTISLPTLGTISGGGTITSNVSVSALLTNFSVSTVVQAVQGLLSGILNLLFKTLSIPVTLPDSTHVFDYYVANGTSIPYSSISGGNLQYAVLAPGVNTVTSTTNPLGIYVVDCTNHVIHLKWLRVYGTLVLLNVGPGSDMPNPCYFAPVTPGYPSLMVQGNINIKPTTGTLSDDSSKSINYNQAGAPYLGATDTTFTTTYPNRMEGIVYVSGNLTSTSATILGSLIVNGTISVTTGISETYDANVYTNAPPGFTTSQLTTVAGSWQWETGP